MTELSRMNFCLHVLLILIAMDIIAAIAVMVAGVFR